MTMTPTTQTEDHFNGWPNVQGFDANFEVKEPVELAVEGNFPAYTAGTLYRTGPGKYKVDTEQGTTLELSHWFDGYSQTHRFQLVAPDGDQPLRVYYNSRFSTDLLIEQTRKSGKQRSITFGQKRDPCKAVYDKVQTEYEPADKSEFPHPAAVNVGVTLSVNMPGLGAKPGDGDRWDTATGIKSLWAKTDYNLYKQLDPVSLEPIGLARQQNLHEDLSGMETASHARSDPKTGDVFNYNLAFLPEPTYRVFRISASTGQTTILATFPATPAYLHSLFLTQDYVVLCVWNAHLDVSTFNTPQHSFLDAIQPFDASEPSVWYVIDRQGDQGLVGIYRGPPFFSFHTINAWQEPSSPTHQANSDSDKDTDKDTDIDIVAELVMFDNTDFLFSLYYENLLSNSPVAKSRLAQGRTETTRSTIARFRLPLIPSTTTTTTTSSPPPQKAILERSTCKPISPELPTMNPHYVTRRHRYTYSVGGRGESTFFDCLMKFDSDHPDSPQIWAQHAHSPGEPIFVADPNGTNEDDGVLLSVVLDGHAGKSYLLCLDARDLSVLGRAGVDGPVGFGFHGQHVPVAGGAIPTGDY
ncbi:carotenoid oxygenase family protein [Aspergillus saccharolyticus JOP 1030-1]|uniref:Dioxygenase n=1 Tax=Aspergillus saccharolyticus JOP 1030-1 TaxID=1450539 RepID=A0A318ZKI6_9EURO|nr:hypothetical protein BP01DRAFT_314422 [Aspergillus saccharolyticus JOP 1030-1]PYH47377.1 hypothetical protein BP01DRAFT_314422 [Aspergillus saccharolyticus JOP 1030-1]